MKTLKNLYMALILALFAVQGFSQTALFETTLSEALDATEQDITVAAVTGVDADDIAVVDKEAMKVISVSGTTMRVQRGVGGTVADNHTTARAIFIDEPDRFINIDLAGACTAGSEFPNYTPLISISTGKRYLCTASEWREQKWQQLTLGQAQAEDVAVLFDGNAQNFYVGLDDSADDLILGVGYAVGTTPAIAIDENSVATFSADPVFIGTTPSLTIGDAGAEDAAIFFDGNAIDFHIGLDDSADTLIFGYGVVLGTTPAFDISATGIVTVYTDPLLVGTTPTLTIGDAGEEDAQINFDGNVIDFHIGHDDSTDKLTIGYGTALGTTPAITVATGPVVAIVDATLSIGGIAYEFPGDDGDSGEQLQTNGTGTLSWESAGSLAKYKEIGAPDISPNEALAKLVSAPVLPFTYRVGAGRSTGDAQNVYHGVMGDDFPEVMHHNDEVFDPVSAFGFTVLSIQALQQEILDLKKEISANAALR